MIGKVPAFFITNHSAESGIYQQNNLTTIMKGNFGLFVALILSGVLCSCSQKEDPSPTPTPTSVPVSAITLNPTSLTLTEGETSTITATVSPSNATNQKVIWSSSDASVATVNDGKVSGISKGTAVISATSDDNGKVAQCTVTVNAKSGSGSGGNTDPGNSMTAVDLGLSVKWASYNLGANSVEGYGDYYAWGEIETKNSYSWSNYKWCKGSKTTLTKYNTDASFGTVDNKGELSAEDDVAHVKLGGEWRIPTKAEWEELRYECTWTWTNYNLVTGYLITADNGNSIFLPAAGQKIEDEITDVAYDAFYQSSSIDKTEPYYAWGLYESSRNLWVAGYDRYYGTSIRPVCGTAILTGDISISVLVLTSSDCTVSIRTYSSDTYYIGLIEKSTWEKYGGDYVCDYLIKDDKDNGVLKQYLYSGDQSFDVHELSAKTEYVVFATFCNSNGKRSGELYSMSFKMK